MLLLYLEKLLIKSFDFRTRNWWQNAMLQTEKNNNPIKIYKYEWIIETNTICILLYTLKAQSVIFCIQMGEKFKNKLPKVTCWVAMHF